MSAVIITCVTNHSQGTQEAALLSSDAATINSNDKLYLTCMLDDNYLELYINGFPVGKNAGSFLELNL